MCVVVKCVYSHAHNICTVETGLYSTSILGTVLYKREKRESKHCSESVTHTPSSLLYCTRGTVADTVLTLELYRLWFNRVDLRFCTVVAVVLM